MAIFTVIDVAGSSPEASLFIPYSELPKHMHDQPLVLTGKWNSVFHILKCKNPQDALKVNWNRGGAIINLDAEDLDVPRGSYKLENLAVKINGQGILVTGVNDATMASRGIKPVEQKPYHLTAPRTVPGQQLEIPPKTLFRIDVRISHRPTQGLVIALDKSAFDMDLGNDYVMFAKHQNRYRMILTDNSQKGFKIRKNSLNRTREIVISAKNCEIAFGVLQPISEPTDYQLTFVKSPDSNIVWSKFEPPGFLDGTSDKNQDVAQFLAKLQELNGLASTLKKRGLTMSNLLVQDGKIATVDLIAGIQTIDHAHAVEKITRTITYDLKKT